MTAPTHTFTSVFNPHATVRLDPWTEANPLLADAQQVMPATVAAATASNGEPPTEFVTGPRPPFLASGVDPQYLDVLPWRTRHAAASHPDSGQVLAWLESYASDPDAELPSPGLDDYIGRFRLWLAGKWTNPAFRGVDTAAASAADDALFDNLFGAQNAAIDAKIAAVNAANPPIPTTAAGRAAFRQEWTGRAQR